MTGIAHGDMANYLTLCDNMGLDLVDAIEDFANEVGMEPNNIDWDNIEFESDVIDRALYHKLIFEYDLSGVDDLIVTAGEGVNFRYVDEDGETLADFDALYGYLLSKVTTRVVFRQVSYPDGSGELVALFPEIPYGYGLYPFRQPPCDV